MNYLLDQMPDEARLWVYQSERQFTGDELEVIKEKIEFFFILMGGSWDFIEASLSHCSQSSHRFGSR